MPTKLTSKLPKYRHHKARNLVVVHIDGQDFYLGRFDSPVSRERYNRLIAEWLTTGNPPAPRRTRQGEAQPADGPTVNEIILAFFKHADAWYRRADGSPTGELRFTRPTPDGRQVASNSSAVNDRGFMSSVLNLGPSGNGPCRGSRCGSGRRCRVPARASVRPPSVSLRRS